MSGREDRLDAEALEVGGDLRSPAVYDDGPQPGVAQEDDVLRERPLQRIVDHGVAAKLDDDGAPVEPLQPRQRLDEQPHAFERGRMSPAPRALRVGRPDGGRGSGHVEYAEFSCT
jgi:hypothetical protein